MYKCFKASLEDIVRRRRNESFVLCWMIVEILMIKYLGFLLLLLLFCNLDNLLATVLILDLESAAELLELVVLGLAIAQLVGMSVRAWRSGIRGLCLMWFHLQRIMTNYLYDMMFILFALIIYKNSVYLIILTHHYDGSPMLVQSDTHCFYR